MVKKKKTAKKSTARKKVTNLGRPKTTGTGTPLVVRMHDDQLKALDAWIADTNISRPEAVRQLITWGLETAAATATPA